MKKTLLFVLLALLLPLVANAYDFESGGIYYNFNSDGTSVTVTYKTTSYNSYSGSVVIPSTVTYNDTEYSVTSIGSDAFCACRGLTSVTIPNSVTSIGYGAFYGCSGLTKAEFASIESLCKIEFGSSANPLYYAKHLYINGQEITDLVIPNSVTSIGGSVFYNCSSLTSVTIPESVTSIGTSAFYNCSGLTSVTIPNSVTSIGKSAFYGCSGLTSVTIGNSVTSIGNNAFYHCSSLKSVTINSNNLVSKTSSSNNLKTIFGSQVKEYILGDDIKSIGSDAFYACSGLTSVTIGNSVTSIGEYAFSGCSSLTSVTIPNSVTSIGESAFRDCSGLTSITIGNNVTSIGDWAFDGCSGLTSVTIPNSVTSIGAYVFYGCSGLTSITIGNNVTSIGNNAFYNCSSLKSVTINSNNLVSKTYTSSSNIKTLFGSQVKEYVLGDDVKGIGNQAFYKCSGLTSITIPNSVTSIGHYAFSGCTGLTSVTIPNSVTSIGGYAFSYCSGMTSVTIPNSVTSIGEYAFSGCIGLTSLKVEEGNPKYDSRNNSNAIIESSTNTLIAGCKTTTIPNSVTSIGDNAFRDCSGLTSITIPESVTSIGEQAFSGCSGLTSVTIGNSVTSIESSAFYGTAWFNNQPDGLVYAGKFAYKYKGTMPTGTHITLEEGTLGIVGYAFYNCSGLTSVTIPNSVTSIGVSAFEGCTGLTSMTIPNRVTSIGERAFEYCTGLTSVTIPKSVTSIGNYAFQNCGGLTSVYCQAKIIPSTGVYAFQNSSVASATLYVPGPAVNSYKSTAPWSSFGKIEPYYDFESDNICYKINEDGITVSITSCETDPYDTYSGSVVIPSTIKYQNKVYNVTSIGNDAFPATTKIYVDNGVLPLIAVWKYGRNPYDLRTNTCLTNPFDTRICSNASSIGLINNAPTNLIKIENESLTIDGVTKTGQNASITGLTPNTSYQIQYNATITYGDGSSTYTATGNITTEALTLTTSQPKVISLGNAVVGAISNLDDAEENVGFEWRRTDWTDDFASNTGAAYLYEGTMEGYIRNLYTEKLWKVRPYYKSNSGNLYYGDWVGIDPTNTSYFEPTVHTYAKINVTGNKASVSGYVQRGSDEVRRQGFMYWISESGARVAADAGLDSRALAASAVPSSAKTIEAEGRVMEVELTGLKPNTTYAYVAFVTTTEGETFYGKQLSFTTGDDPEASVTGDANGNGVVEIGDVTSVLTLMATPEATGYNNKAADANGNGVIEIGDVTTILTIMAGGN